MKAIEKIWENIGDIFEEYQSSEELKKNLDEMHTNIEKLNISKEEKEVLFAQISDVTTIAEKQGFLYGYDLANRLLLGK